MDGDGIPLAFNITPGNTNEQTTLTQTEQKILDDFKLSKFIVYVLMLDLLQQLIENLMIKKLEHL